MTPAQACGETRDLWTEMARLSVEEKRIIEKSEVPGPWQSYRHFCPCCEYIRFDYCLPSCPMYREWAFYSGNDDAPCQGDRSPYQQWRELRYALDPLCIDVEFFCLLIAEMAEEARMRYTAESQPTLVEDKDIEYIQMEKGNKETTDDK